MSSRYLPCVLALAVLASACSGSGHEVQIFGGDTDRINSHITLHDGVVTIKAPDAPDATVDQNGKLAVAGKDVAVSDAQRELLQHYNATARKMHDDAIATGKAGAETAAKALGAVAGKMTGADTAEETQKKAEAAAQDVRLAAAKICDDVAEMKSTQDTLVAQLDAFKPYGQALTDSNVEKCRNDSKH
jgi:hypothetical protein